MLKGIVALVFIIGGLIIFTTAAYKDGKTYAIKQGDR
jgi:hypothetical protein